MEDHILIKKAFKYFKKPEDRKTDKNYLYNEKKGFWISKETGEPAIYDPRFKPPKTKKEDRETGEDQKGE